MSRIFLCAAILATSALASPAPDTYPISHYIKAATSTPANNDSSTIEPCAEISIAQQAGYTTFDSDIALQCLQSVPLHTDDGQLQLQGLKALVQFQTTLAYLKDPPPGYLYPAVDVEGGLDALSDLLDTGFYNNEYDFQVDIAQLIASAYDGHFAYIPDIVGIFSFERTDSSSPFGMLSLISVSKDGVALPDVYDFNDQPALVLTNVSGNYTPSPIQQINGQDVQEALNAYASIIGGNQDPDANYNTLFPSLTDKAGNVPCNSFGSGTYYLGTATVLTFANGTEKRVQNVAVTSSDFSDVTDGTSFFQAFCTGNALEEYEANQNATSSSNSTTNTTEPIQTQVPYTPIPTGQILAQPSTFPEPLAIAADQSVAGYLPASEPDLAVISLPNYEPADDVQVDFEDVIRETLATAKSLGKTKLIIDLRGNPGGTVFLAYDTFKQLFPSAVPRTQQNIRAHDAYNWLGEVTSQFYTNVTTANATLQDGGFGGPLEINYREVLGANGKHFSNWGEFFGPNVIHDDNFTSLFRANLSDTFQTIGTAVYGYLNDSAPQPQTFAAEDIVLLQDGNCASTCTVFAELMKNIMGVKTVVVGGRKQDGPMQGVGGVKGSSVQPMFTLQRAVAGAYSEFATDAQQSAFDNVLGTMWFNSTTQALNRAAPYPANTVFASVNFQNNIRPGDETVTPLQFVYEAADCRFFYTAAMYSQQELVWKQAYDLMWGNGFCVPGSTGQSSSGNITGAGEEAAAPADATNFFGGNDTIYPSADLGPAVNSTATATGTSATGTVLSATTNGAGSRTVSAGVVVAAMFAAVFIFV